MNAAPTACRPPACGNWPKRWKPPSPISTTACAPSPPLCRPRPCTRRSTPPDARPQPGATSLAPRPRTVYPGPMTELESFAVELSREAARAALPFFRGAFVQEDQGVPGAFHPVTDADRAAEAAIRRLIAARYPDHGVIGEEYGEDRPEAEHVWVLDPIDGTRAFIAGLPLWTTLIALRQDGAPVVGAVGQPYLGEVFLGGPSGARLLKGAIETPLRTRACARLDQALIATTDPEIFTGADRAAGTGRAPRPAWPAWAATATPTP